jgi:hypothetical protein
LTGFGIWSSAKRRSFVLQASEGGSFSVGKRKFKVKQSVTPRPVLKPPASGSLEGVPVAMPTNLRTSRMSRLSPLRLTTLSPATDKMVVSKSALVGFCLTAFAGGVVMTLAVDRAHARAAEPPREPEPVVLKTTTLEAAPAAVAPPTALAPPPIVPAAAPAPPAAAPRPAVAAPAVPTVASPSATEALVVQMAAPPEQENQAAKTTPHPLPASAVHVARKVAAPAPVPAPAPHAARKVAAAGPVRPRKQAHAIESSPTEAAPDEDPALPTTTKKKWADPFDP